MGRGLSETQRRILLWAEKHQSSQSLPLWFDGLNNTGKGELAGSLLDRDDNLWTKSDYASVSRSLRRLAARRLIERIPVLYLSEGRMGKRTERLFLTEAGKEMVARLRASDGSSH